MLVEATGLAAVFIARFGFGIRPIGESGEIPIQKDKLNYDLLLIDPKRKLIMILLVMFVLITAVTVGGWLLFAAMSTMYGTNNSYSKYFI